MLQLAAAAFAEMAARRRRAIRAGRQRSVGRDPVAGHPAGDMASIRGHAVAARGAAFDQISIRHIFIRSSARSEEHTSELQSLMRISYAAFCLKKKTQSNTIITVMYITMRPHVPT